MRAVLSGYVDLIKVCHIYERWCVCVGGSVYVWFVCVYVCVNLTNIYFQATDLEN